MNRDNYIEIFSAAFNKLFIESSYHSPNWFWAFSIIPIITTYYILKNNNDQVDVKFNKWKKKIIFFEKWIIKNNLSKLEANIRFLKNFKEVDKIIVGINDAFELSEIFSFLKKKSLKIPEYLNIKAGIILNPKEWKI